MSETMTAILGGLFLLVMLFVLWLKFHEHLHLHRHEHGPHTHRTDLRQKMMYRLSKSGMMRRRGDKE
jgi:hypothetical protein